MPENGKLWITFVLWVWATHCTASWGLAATPVTLAQHSHRMALAGEQLNSSAFPCQGQVTQWHQTSLAVQHGTFRDVQVAKKPQKLGAAHVLADSWGCCVHAQVKGQVCPGSGTSQVARVPALRFSKCSCIT